MGRSLTTLDSRRQREIFLDAWFASSPKSFKRFHKAFGGSGKKMIDALEEHHTRLFIDIFERAEDLAVSL